MCVLFVLAKLAQWAHFYLQEVQQEKRAALPNARVMIHQPLGGFRGQASDIQIHAQEILKIKQTLNERLAFHTGQSIERIEKDTDRDNFMSAEEAKAYGLVDDVLIKR